MNMAYLTFEQGLKFPWQKPKRLWYGLWILVPIFGWLALAGFGVKIIRNLVKGKNKEVPEFGNFWENFMDGLTIILKMIPLIISIMVIEWVLLSIPVIGILLYIIYIILIALLVPYLFINLVIKWKVRESFDLNRAWCVITGNFRDYVIVWLKSLGLGIIYGILSLVLIGIPCSMYSKQYFFCDFYRKAK